MRYIKLQLVISVILLSLSTLFLISTPSLASSNAETYWFPLKNTGHSQLFFNGTIKVNVKSHAPMNSLFSVVGVFSEYAYELYMRTEGKGMEVEITTTKYNNILRTKKYNKRYSTTDNILFKSHSYHYTLEFLEVSTIGTRKKKIKISRTLIKNPRATTKHNPKGVLKISSVLMSENTKYKLIGRYPNIKVPNGVTEKWERQISFSRTVTSQREEQIMASTGVNIGLFNAKIGGHLSSSTGLEFNKTLTELQSVELNGSTCTHYTVLIYQIIKNGDVFFDGFDAPSTFNYVDGIRVAAENECKKNVTKP